MSYLVLDLETVPDPALPPPPPREDGADRVPAPVHCRIVSASGLVLRNDYSVAALKTLTDEREAIHANVAYISRNDVTVVTFAGRFFDMPVLAARAFLHGIPFPRYYAPRRGPEPDMRSRYGAIEGGHLDLSDYLADFGVSRRARMDAWAKAIGFPGKGDVDGGDVAGMMAAGKLEEVAQYNREDVVQETAIFLRTQLQRGELDAAGYRRAMGGLLEWMAGYPGMGRLLAGVDCTRALAVYEPAPPAQVKAEPQGAAAGGGA